MIVKILSLVSSWTSLCSVVQASNQSCSCDCGSIPYESNKGESSSVLVPDEKQLNDPPFHVADFKMRQLSSANNFRQNETSNYHHDTKLVIGQSLARLAPQ